MTQISCVLPAYNEGARIGDVLKLVTNHHLINEVIVVDDGSQDNTKEVVATHQNVKLIVHPQNQGKSAAICHGIEASSGDLILMLDADLVGLTEQNFNDLISPVLTGEAEVSINIGKNAPFFFHWLGLDFLSGQRLMPRQIFIDHLAEILELPGFGLEVFLNDLTIKNKYKIKIVPWLDVVSPFKFRKYGFWTGMMSDVGMFIDIFKTVSPLTPIYQIIGLIRLKV